MHGIGSGAKAKQQPYRDGNGQGRARHPSKLDDESKNEGTSEDERESEADGERVENDDLDTDVDSDPSTRMQCPECGGAIINDDAHAERVCSECGLIVKADEIDRGPEWHSFSDDETNRSRVGSPSTPLQHDKGLSTQIGWQNKDAYGNPLSAKRRKQMHRLRERDEWFRTRNSKERTLKQALGEIQRMGSALGFEDDVREMASIIYRRASEERLLLGRSIEAVATASLYAACRQAGVPRTPDEIAATSRTGKLEFERAYRCIVTELGLAVESTAAESYVPQFTSNIKFDEPKKVEALAREILEAGRDENLHSGRSPSGLAGAAIYAAALTLDENITQPAVADAADTTCVTIRSHYRDFLKAADLPVPDSV